MNLFLIGLPGSGKTTVGRILAQRLRRPFADLDEEIERASGRTIPDIFARSGEPCFRELESRTLAALCRADGRVIATGGGTVLRPENRCLLSVGRVVLLDRTPWEIRRTLSSEGRPLLQSSTLEQLAAERGALYRACAHLCIRSRSPEEAAAQIEAYVRREEIL